MKNILYIILGVFTASTIWAQQTPGEKQSESIILIGGTAHLGNGEVIQNSTIGFTDGKIDYIGTVVEGNDRQTRYSKKIDATGKHIYPGFIVMNSTLGINEIGAVRATNDNREVGYLNPSVRSIIAYNTDSRVIPTIRSQGILLAQIVPQGGAIPGQSSIVHLDAWNWEDAAIKLDDGIHINWPPFYRRSGWWAEPGPINPNKEYPNQKRNIKAFMSQASAYAKGNPEVKNLKMESMRGLFDGSKKAYVHVGGAKATMDAVKTFQSLGITPIVIGGTESYLIADFLKTNNVSVIYESVHSLPSYQDDDIDQRFKIPLLLSQAGVDFSIGMSGYWGQRVLPHHAGHAVSYGLEYEKAVQALTLNTAKILGIDANYGSLEQGKSATLFISEGDALDMRTCRLTHAFIDGRTVDLDNKQKALDRKFRKKYEVRGN